MEQLFSVEVFVKTILLYDSVQPVPTRNDIDVNVIFGKVLNLVISPENIIDQKPPQQLTDMEEVEVEKVSVKSEKSQKSEMPKKAHIQIDEDKGTLLVNCGKSYLFHANTKELQEQFADCEFSIEVTRREDSKHIGLTNFDFIEDFNNYIENSGSNETNSESLVIDKSLRIKDMATDEKVGIIEILIRFTAFGDNVQTTFEIIDTNRDNPYEPSNRFIFKNVRCPTSFKIETFNAEQLQEVGMPVPGAPILGAADIEVAQLKPLFITSFKSRQSVMVPYFKDQMEKNTINQVFIKTGGPTNKIGRPINEITASTINASLCGNKCCPVALKFKELGLGPLASKNVGLGAMSGKVKANTTYGLSQGYGVMDNYGPFGLLKRRQSKCSCEVEDLSKVVNCGCLKSDSVVNYKADHTDKCMPGSCPFNGMMPKDDRVVKTPDAESQDGCGCLGASVLLKDSDACAVASCPFRVRKEPKPRKINCGCLGKGSFNSHSKGSFRSFNGSDAGNCCCSSPKKSKKEGCGCGLTNFPRSRAGADDFCGGQSCKLSKVEPATCNPICPGGGLQKPQKCGSRKCPMSDTDSIMKPEMPFTMFQPNRDHYALASRLETPPAARRSQRASFVPDFDLTPSPRSCFPPPSCPPPRPSCPPAPVCPPPRPCCPPPRPSCPPPRPSCPPAPVCPPPRPACSPRLTFPPPCCPPECPPQPRCPPRASCPQGPSCPFCPPSPVCPPRPNCPPRSCPFCPPMCPPKPICPPRPNCPPRPSCPPAQTNYPPRESYGTVSSRRSFGSSNFQSQCKTCSCLDDDREDASSLDKCVFDNCPFSVKEEDFNCCGGQPCPFVSDVLNQDTNQEYMGNGDPFYRQTAVTLENCGSPCCPLANFLELEKKFDELTRNDTCGKPDCPFAAVLEKDPDCSCLEARASLMSWCRRNRMSEAKPETIEEQPEPEKVQKKKKPCKRNACKKMKMLTCEECGGVSASGATCSNPLGNVPFNDDWSDDATDASSMASKDERRSTKREAEGAPLPIMDEKKPLPIQKIKHSEKHPRHRSRFVYRDGEYYPGIRVGHRTCAASGKNVPSNMGWLWNCEPASGMRRRRGWKPGVIGKTINERIINHRRELGIPDPPELKMLVSKKKFRQSKFPCDDESDEEVEPKPTLHIRKKDGVYFITMNPLKDPKSLAENENPYMDCTPMQFTITKNKPEVPAVTDAPAIREHGEDREGSPISSKSSLYGNSYKDCLCSEDEELVESSSESELDIEFTTPAGLIFPERFKRKPNVIHTETQFNEADLTDPDCVYLSPTNKQRKKKVRLRR